MACELHVTRRRQIGLNKMVLLPLELIDDGRICMMALINCFIGINGLSGGQLLVPLMLHYFESITWSVSLSHKEGVEGFPEWDEWIFWHE